MSDDIQWIKGASQNGAPFEFGIRKSDYSPEIQKKVEEALGDKDKAPTGTPPMPVNWPVGDDNWKPTTGDVSGYINRYKLHANHGGIFYDYQLDFTAKETGTYVFWDESKDYYKVTVILPGDHYVRYNSGRPTINYVELS